MVLWALLGSEEVAAAPRAFPEHLQRFLEFCLDPHTMSCSWPQWWESSEQQQHLLSHTGDILGYLGVDPQLLGGKKTFLSQQADIKCRLRAAFWAGLAAEPPAQVELHPPRRRKHSKLVVPTS